MRNVQLMNSPAGRTGRAVAGLALIASEIAVGGIGGLVLAVIGLVPLAAGASGPYPAAPLFRAPVRAR